MKIETINLFGCTERNDCTVRALSTACDISYEVAYEKLKQFGRKKGRGVVFQKFLDNYEICSGLLGDSTLRISELYGKRFTRITGIIPKTINQFLKDYSVGVYLIKSSRHVSVIKDGVLYDRIGRNKRIGYIYFVETI